MTQEQYKWLQDNGYDPTVHDVDDQGNIFENPINAPAPQKEVMSMPRAFGTSFLGNLLPGAASLGGAKVGMMAGAPFGPWGIGLGALGGGLAAGYGVGKGQQALLENYAPEAAAEMQRAETDQPVASWAGGSAPALLTFKPSFKGISGLSAPIMSLEKDAMSKFAPAAINVAVNAGQSGAGQLLNMAQGGDFSLPRFAADTAFGSIVSNPNALGRKMGFPSLDAPNIPKIPVEQPMDLGAIRATEGMTPEEITQYKTKSQMEWWKQDEATRISDIENVAKQSKQRLNKGMADELSRLPEVYDVIKNPEKFPEFLANSLEEALNVSHETAQDRKQSKFLDLKEQERQGNLKTEAAEAEGYFKSEVDQARSLQEANVFRAATANDDATLRAQAVQAENDLKIANAKTEAARIEAEQNATDTRKLQDLDAAQALSDEAAARLQDLYSRQSQLRAETQNKSPAERRGVREQGIADIAQAKQELADARAIAADLYTRLQTAGGKGLMSQADLDAATSLAAQRGLRIVPATPEQQAKGIRGAYVVNENGEGIIYINPFAATADTAIHEIGHDVFKRSPNERMRRSLMDTAEGSEAYKAEYAARIAAQDKNGNPAHTEQQAHDFALEEGIVQAFGEAYPNVKPGEIRQWFNALKSSVKSMLKMKLSPEDAIAWMHYATTEAVPWKGMAVAKTGDVGGEERLQRAQQETPEFKAFYGKSQVVDEQGKPKVVYHGTGSDITQFDKGLLDKYALYGPGIYMTESADVAGGQKGYAFKGLKPDDAITELSVDENLPMSEQLKQAKEQAIKDGFTPEQVDESIFVPGDEGIFYMHDAGDGALKPNAIPLYAKIERPFDIDEIHDDWLNLAQEMDDKAHILFGDKYEGIDFDKLARSESTQNIDGNSLYKALSRSFGGMFGYDGKARANHVLQKMGYDGITHTGGLSRRYGSGEPHKVWIAFEPEQIKSATGNRGTFDPSNPDIRYQRPIVGKAADAVKAGVDKTLGEIDQITRRGGIFETVGRSLTRAYNTEKSMLGKARSLALKIINLDYSDANKLRSHLYNEYRNQQLITPAPEIAVAYKEWRTQAKAFWVAEANKVGHQIDTGKKGRRNRIESEFWFPGHDLSDEVRDILAKKVGTPEYQKLKDDYLRDAEADYLSQGKVMAVAQEKALVDFEEQRALNNKTFDPSAPANFAGARKPMGRPLPESWVEKDFRKTLESYNQRSAKDYASQEHFEKSPEVMAALGSKKFFNGQDIPANILQNTPVIAPDPSIQSVMREFSGQPLQMPGKAIRSIGSAASALALQTISRIGDVGGTVTKPLAYIGLGDYGAYMGGMAEKLSNWSKLKARSIESGLNNPNANQDFHQVIGMGQDAGKYMQKVLDSIGFITGSSKLESVARTLAQAQGEMIVSINKRKAATGDKDAVRFLDTLNYDWRTQSDMALAAQFGDMMQGTYDMRQLPAWFLEGGAAPYLTWSKWSMGQMNNFRKFAVEPAMQGNLKPLIAQVLVGMAGGGAIEQVQEWLSGKESKAVKWSELESWARQNQGKIGTDGGELLMQKFMIMAQKTGTFGFAGDLAMMPINALVGDTQSSVGVFPAAELFADGMKNVAGALTAIDKGEDVGLVLQRFGKNVIVGKTQMARVASTWIDEVFNEGTENLRSSDRRKARLFEELSGTGRSNGMFPVSYENLAEQEFERGSVSEKTGEEAFSLVSRARQEATSGEDYASRIRKLKTSQNAIMPSLERQPMKAARYLGFVEGAEPGKGSETLKRYYTRQNEDKYRKSLIEGMSGIR